jgi:hypothetical protein
MKAKNFLEFALWGSLVLTNAAGSDVRPEVIFPLYRRAGDAAKHSDLAYMVEGIGDRALEELLGGGVKRFAAGEVVVEILEGLEEAVDLLRPRQRLGVVPSLFAISHA